MNEAENVTALDQVRIHHCCVIDQLKVWVICILAECKSSRSSSFFSYSQIFWSVLVREKDTFFHNLYLVLTVVTCSSWDESTHYHSNLLLLYIFVSWWLFRINSYNLVWMFFLFFFLFFYDLFGLGVDFNAYFCFVKISAFFILINSEDVQTFY